MGQYYYVVNIDKKEYLHPHKFNDGLKLLEFGCSSQGTLLGLTILLADGNGRGGGDLHLKRPTKIVGSWAGDRIVIAGDYADDGKWPGVNDDENLYHHAGEKFKEISEPVIRALAQDLSIRDDFIKQGLLDKSGKVRKDRPNWHREPTAPPTTMRPDFFIGTRA